MRIPAFVVEHPVEILIAGILLLALLFGPSDRHVVGPPLAHQSGPQIAAAGNL